MYGIVYMRVRMCVCMYVCMRVMYERMYRRVDLQYKCIYMIFSICMYLYILGIVIINDVYVCVCMYAY